MLAALQLGYTLFQTPHLSIFIGLVEAMMGDYKPSPKNAVVFY